MPENLDVQLTERANRILRGAARVYYCDDDETWLSGYNPVLTAWNSGMFGRLRISRSLQEAIHSPQAVVSLTQGVGHRNAAVGRVFLSQLFCLPSRLPAVRLPSPPELAALARSAPLMTRLDEMAKWLGQDGRPVTRDHLLYDEDRARIARFLDLRPNLLPYLWEYALVSGWLELIDGPDGPRSWVVLGKPAYRWTDGDSQGALHVWATVFASVLARTLEVSADHAPEASRLLNFQGQGVALAIILFLAKRTELTTGDVSEIVKDGAISDLPTRRATRAWNSWLHQFGNPARLLLRELAALRALVPSPQDGGMVALSPLALWALREQFMLEDINIPVIPASGKLSAADIVELADAVSDAEFGTEFEAWISRRSPGRAARDLLSYACSANARGRLAAVRLVRYLGIPAGGAWAEAMRSPQLRGYAHIALAALTGDPPEDRSPKIRNWEPSDFDWVAADMLSLISGDGDPDPDLIAALCAEAIPAGMEEWAFGALVDSIHPGIRLALELLGRYHPDRKIAKHARKAARTASKNRSSAVERSFIHDITPTAPKS